MIAVRHACFPCEDRYQVGQHQWSDLVGRHRSALRGICGAVFVAFCERATSCELSFGAHAALRQGCVVQDANVVDCTQRERGTHPASPAQYADG